MRIAQTTNRRRSRLSWFFWAAALSCLAAESLPTTPVNAGFEEGTTGWRIPGALWRVADGEGRGGSKCLVWEKNDPKRYLFPGYKLALEAGGIYRFGRGVGTDLR